MNKDFVITFKHASDHKRFLTTHITTSIHRDMAIIDLCEEITPPPTKYIIQDESSFERIDNESNIINLIHATTSVHPEQIPGIINTLQILYDNYKKTTNGG